MTAGKESATYSFNTEKMKTCTLKVKSCEQVMPSKYDGITNCTIYVSPEVYAHAT